MNSETFCTLAQHTHDAALTVLYSLPANTTPTRQAHINSVVSEVRGVLKVAGLDEETVSARTEKFEEVLRSEDFRTASGIAYFECGETCHYEAINVPVERTVTCASSFTMAPLATMMGAAPQFFVLALSRGEWRLLRPGTRKVEMVSVPDAPANLEEANDAFEQPIPGGAQHANTSNGNGPGAPRTHVQGFGHEAPDDKRDLRYVEALSRAFAPVIDQTPVVVIGLAPLSSTFRDHANVNVVGVEVVDPQGLDNDELVERATALAPDPDTALSEQFGAATAKGQLVEDTKTLLEQARVGNISVLVAPEAAKWVAQSSNTPQDAAGVGSIDAVTVAMGAVLAHGGEVVSGSTLKGIQRWPTSPVAK